jgi:anaphase-promoting complex subunit 10
MIAPTVTISNQITEYPYEREVGSEAVFTISSAKPGNGVEQLRDGNLETYWQSDGSFPHLINVQFARKVSVTKVCLYLNYAVDESYTPRKVTLSVGSCPHDLTDLISAELQEPTGWVVIDCTDNENSGTTSIRCHYLQVKVSSMHQNGKDTHIRQIKVYGRRLQQRVMADLCHDDFLTVEMAQFCVLR